MHKRKREGHAGLLLMIVAALAGSVGAAPAQSAREFYAGKTISLVIGSAAGGLFDGGGRLFAQYLQKYIPGHPSVVPRNMPGASSEVAAQYLYNVAPHDGLTLGTLQPTIVLDKSLDPSLHYDPNGFTWIGRVQPLVFVGIAWRASGVESIEDARKRTVIVSAQGATGISAMVPFALNRLAATKFKVISGYESQGPAFIAMERGEVQGLGSSALSDVLKNKEWPNHHRIAFLYSITEKRSDLEPQAPAIPELATDAKGREVLTLIGRGQDVGQMVMAPPGIPKERKDALRSAFDEMIKDPSFVAEARKLGVVVDSLNGDALAALVRSATTASPEILRLMRDATRPQ